MKSPPRSLHLEGHAPLDPRLHRPLAATMTLHGKHRVRIGDLEIETKDWTLNMTNDFVDATSWEAKDKTNLVGLTDTHGSFSGVLSISEDDALDDLGDEAEVYLYGPALLPWYREWWIGFRGKEWPDMVHAHGPAYVSSTITQSEDGTRIEGTFNQSGKWTINTSHDPWSWRLDYLRMRFWNWRHR